jgi:hypothetical protein
MQIHLIMNYILNITSNIDYSYSINFLIKIVLDNFESSELKTMDGNILSLLN